ncbi:TIGR00730 family Rossman fold protein [Qingshengfaniella alkalisoli]|uniref:Cytokinin riboside 5'-monophosphate phosphoribohydrolase n=1 Tax=Qingshengfaniella alkalisoli TaxID=2599296 RepID=A0A5B8IVT1_9RHOB|nr:TIGR00730 family Rossman fold protein [Qingshengfaniella alkalisoli]QDY68981.1 TIGR00730 family Rossman fold protein [Qingshengfaniella alkalisoli]
MSAPDFAVCVYCGSRFGAKDTYRIAASALGTAIATEGWQLVYGAGDVGLMGETARQAQAAGGDTLGVIPTHLMALEVGKRDLTRFIVTETMHERKKVMFMNAHAIIVQPGGAGTLDEFFEVLTWKQLGLHDKPVILLNIDGFWSPLVTAIDQIIDQGFAEPSLREKFTVVESTDAAIDLLRRFRKASKE